MERLKVNFATLKETEIFWEQVKSSQSGEDAHWLTPQSLNALSKKGKLHNLRLIIMAHKTIYQKTQIRERSIL